MSSKYEDDLLKIFFEKNAALKRKALETKSFNDVMKFLYSIHELISHYGGAKTIFKNSWRKHNPKIWSSFQSDIFAWLLMMVLQKQEENQKSWSLIFYEYLCEDKYQQFNVLTPQMTQVFKELLQGFKIHLPQDLHIEAESIIEFFELHHIDPYSALVGQRATKEVAQRSQQISDNLLEVMLENISASTQTDDKRKKKPDYRDKCIDLLKKITNISLIQVSEDSANELQRFISILRGVNQLLCGSLVIVNTNEDNKEGGIWRFARVARKSQGSLVLVYLDPRETIVSSFPFSRVLPVSPDILEEFYLQDDPSSFETYIEHPENTLLLSILQHYTKEAQLFLENMRINMDTFQLALKNQSTIYHSEELQKISQALKTPPKDILEKMNNYANSCIQSHLDDLETSPPWAVFQPTKEIRKQELLSFHGDEMFKLELKKYYNICDNSIIELQKRKDQILLGVIKSEINDWWHRLIQNGVETYLSNQGYEISAVRDNYVDKPPENILAVQKNLQLLQRILQSFYQNFDTFKLKDLIKSICTKIYARIEKYIKEVKYCICEIAKIKVIDYKPEKVLNNIKNDPSISENIKIRVKALVDDNNYLAEMQEMEEMRSSDRGRLDIVPVSGLVLSVICRLENECRTVLDLWENKSYVKDEDSKTPLENAVLKQDIKGIETILKIGTNYINDQDSEGWTILHLSCSYWNNQSRLEVTKYLLEHEEMNLLLTTNYGSSPLHFLVRMPIPDNEKPHYISLLKLYLKNNLVSHICDKKGESPLHVATLAGNILAVRELLLVSADPNCATESGETCLHYAVSSQQKEIVKLLIDHSANPTIKNSQGESPIDIAVKLNLQDIRLLLEGSQWNEAKIHRSQTISEIRTQAQISIKESRKLTPLWSKSSPDSQHLSQPILTNSGGNINPENDSKVEWKKAALPPELAALLEKEVSNRKTSGVSGGQSNEGTESLLKDLHANYRSGGSITAPLVHENVKEELEDKFKKNTKKIIQTTISSTFDKLINKNKNNNNNNNNNNNENNNNNNNNESGSGEKPVIPPRPPSISTGAREKYHIAIYNFEGKIEDGELPFVVNDVIKVITEDESGWWFGKCKGVSGIFPENYTKIHTQPKPIIPSKPIPTPPSSNTSSPINSPVSNNNNNINSGGSGISRLNKAASVASIRSTPLNQISLNTPIKSSTPPPREPSNNINNNVINNSPVVEPSANVFPKKAVPSPVSRDPSNNNNNNNNPVREEINKDNKDKKDYIPPPNKPAPSPYSREETSSSNNINNNNNPVAIEDNPPPPKRAPPSLNSPSAQSQGGSQPSGGSQRLSSRELPKTPPEIIAVVLADFLDPHPSCLNLQKGEKVRVLAKNDDGWWRCQTISTNDIGLFPKTYLEVELRKPVANSSPSSGTLRTLPLPPI